MVLLRPVTRSLTRPLTRSVLGSAGLTLEQQVAAALATYSDAGWFDPSDLTSIRQDRDAYPDDSQGADGQPVGMWIDRSWGGENTTGATVAEMLAAATEVAANSGFDTDSDWTKTTPGSSSITISGGTCTLQGGASEFPNIRQAVLTVGDWYHLSIDKMSGATSNQNDLEIRFGTGSGAFRLGTQPAGTYTIIQQAASTANFEIIKRGTETGPIEIDNVVLKRIPRLLVAPTDGARPTLTVSGGLTYLSFNGSSSLLEMQSAMSGVDFVSAVRFEGAGNQTVWGSNNVNLLEVFFYVHSATDLYVYSPETAANTVHDEDLQNDDVVLYGRLGADGLVRVNGVLSDTGDETYTSSPVWQLGARDSSGSPQDYMDGRFYGGALITEAASAADISLLEQWAAEKSGVPL